MPTHYIIVLYTIIEPDGKIIKTPHMLSCQTPTTVRRHVSGLGCHVVCPFAPLSNASGISNQLQNTKPKDGNKHPQYTESRETKWGYHDNQLGSMSFRQKAAGPVAWLGEALQRRERAAAATAPAWPPCAPVAATSVRSPQRLGTWSTVSSSAPQPGGDERLTGNTYLVPKQAL